MSYRLAVDVGGTFTDLLLFEEGTGRLTLTKTPSTPADPSIGVITGIHKVAKLAGIHPNQISLILHGTTVATNTVLEEKGAKVGLITNRGFEQILHVARGQLGSTGGMDHHDQARSNGALGVHTRHLSAHER